MGEREDLLVLGGMGGYLSELPVGTASVLGITSLSPTSAVGYTESLAS